MSNYRGKEYLKRKLKEKEYRVNTRYRYYEMKNHVKDFGISTPPNLKTYFTAFGWCARAVDTLADRLSFKEMSEDNFNMNNIFEMNNPDVLFDSAMLSALISSCCFIYISRDDDEFPRLQVIDGANATGIIDPITGLLKEGYAVLQRKQKSREIEMDAYFTSEYTEIQYPDKFIEKFDHKAGYPLLVPIIYRPDAKRDFGHSRISRACMDIQNSAMRTIKRSEISAEFYSFPQKYAVGLANDAELPDKWKTSLSSFLFFTKDEDGGDPKLGQFQQQSQAPHLEQLKMLASIFAAETGLTLDDLGFPTSNPSSSDAIKAAHENLRLTARKAQRTFGSGFLNVGFVAACLRDEFNYKRDAVRLTKPTWYPLFEPDVSALSGIGDALNKLQQSFPNYITEDKLSEMVGI